MHPTKGQNVQLFLRYNISVEGVVREWSEEQIVLVSGVHHFIVYNPREDLIVAKIMGKSRLSGIVSPGQSNINPIAVQGNVPQVIDTLLSSDYNIRSGVEEIEADIAETIASPSNNPLRLKKLAQLKTMLAETEKEIISSKLSNHQIQPEVKVQYANPIALFKRNK